MTSTTIYRKSHQKTVWQKNIRALLGYYCCLSTVVIAGKT